MGLKERIVKLASSQERVRAKSIKTAGIQVGLPGEDSRSISKWRLLSGEHDLPWDQDKKRRDATIRYIKEELIRNHHLIPVALEIICILPVQDMSISCESEEVKEEFEKVFFEQLDYKNFYREVTREFVSSGEVTTLLDINPEGEIVSEQILDPLSIEAHSPLISEGEDLVSISLPSSVVDIITNKLPEADYNFIAENHPEWIQAAKSIQYSNKPLHWYPEDPSLVWRAVNRASPWDLYGTPFVQRTFHYLELEEKLHESQWYHFDRLMNPLLLWQLGNNEWKPQQKDLDNMSSMVQKALSAKERSIFYHDALNVKNVLGRDIMPDYNGMQNHIDDKVLQSLGISPQMLTGGNSQTYSTASLSRDLLSQILSDIQEKLQNHWRKRATYFAKLKNFRDHDNNLIIPELTFKAISFKEDKTIADHLKSLRQMDVPLSDQTLAASENIDLSQEISLVEKEKVDKIIAEAKLQKAIIEAFEKEGLPVPPNYQEEPVSDIATEPQTPNLVGPVPKEPNSGSTENEESSRPKESDEQRSETYQSVKGE